MRVVDRMRTVALWLMVFWVCLVLSDVCAAPRDLLVEEGVFTFWEDDERTFYTAAIPKEPAQRVIEEEIYECEPYQNSTQFYAKAYAYQLYFNTNAKTCGAIANHLI